MSGLEPAVIALIATTVVSTTSAIIAVFRKNIRRMSCFGRACIDFRNESPNGSGGLSPMPPKLPKNENKDIGNISPATNVNINFPDKSNEIKITTI